jgi:hypothetical protein
MIEKKKAKIHIPHWRDDIDIRKRIDAVRKKNKNAAYADTMRKIVRDGLEANE